MCKKNLATSSHKRIVISQWHVPSGARIEKVKAHVERRKQSRDTWTFQETGNFIADIVAGPEYRDKLHQEGLQPLILSCSLAWTYLGAQADFNFSWALFEKTAGLPVVTLLGISSRSFFAILCGFLT